MSERRLDLDAIEAAAKAASRGTWEVAVGEDEYESFEELPNGGTRATTETYPYPAIRTSDDTGSWEIGRTHHDVDAQFIAAVTPAVVLALVAAARQAADG